jgi:3-hydroxybutyryl-CoA dehydrogenase
VRIEAVGVVGLGTMGAGIAEVFARAGLRVVAVEVGDAMLAAGRDRLSRSLARAVDRGRLEQSAMDDIFGRCSFTTDRNDLAAVGLVVEAVPERLDIKTSLFDELDRICPPDTVLATNTSSLPVTRIAAATGRPGRVIGMHFFNPAPVMKLVEVVTTVLTDPDVAGLVRELAERCGKTPVVVGDRAGFVANALLFGYLNQAARMVESGHASVVDIDTAITVGTGLPMGPLTLMDLIGLDVCLEVIDVMYDETRDQRYAAAPQLRRLVMARRLGRKTGAGYFRYDDSPTPTPTVGIVGDDAVDASVGRCTVAVVAADADAVESAEVAKAFDAAADPATADLVAHLPRAPRTRALVELAPRTPAGTTAMPWARSIVTDLGRTPVLCRPRPGYVLEALLFPHLNDAARMVDEGYATDGDVDAAMRLGCGYPQGPFEMLTAVGAAAVVDGLPGIAATAPTPAMVTSPLLVERAGR